MKYLIALVVLTGCSLQVKSDEETTKIIKQHTIMLNAIGTYIATGQNKGVFPKPDDLNKLEDVK